MKKVGFFGGSFDPIHLGHLSLAVDFVETRAVEEVWFSPALVSPFKQGETPLSFEHRYAMCCLATENHPRLKVIDVEKDLPPPSYTYLTLKYLQKKHPECHFSFFLGQDALVGLPKWHQALALVQEFPLLIGVRPPFNKETIHLPTEFEKAIERALHPTRSVEVSSTELRKRLKNRAFCEHLMPKKVLDYIDLNSLYLSS